MPRPTPFGARALHVTALGAILAGCSNDIQVADTKNSPPAALINAPTSGSAYAAGEVVEFLGVVSDPNGLDDVNSVVWTSTLDGELGDIQTATPDADGLTRLAVVLGPGNHGVSLRVTDVAGTNAEDSVNISVGEAVAAPMGTLESPANFAEYLPGDEVDLSAIVSDQQDDAEDLSVEFVITNNATQTVDASYEVVPTQQGLASAVWTAGAAANYRVTLNVADVDGNQLTPPPEVLIVVNDPSLADRDGDNFSPATGDCDDEDADVNPGAEEICGGAVPVDNDCDTEIDNRDEDNDGHVDEDCVNYGGPLPDDDCDDSRSDVYPGAYELQDGVDNDCDGAIDNGGLAYDDDGDCWCEVGPCSGSTNLACAGSVLDGDCDDANASLSPDEIDDPDAAFTDTNCDQIDGDTLDAVFLDPVGGNDGNVGDDPLAPKRSLTSAYQAASSLGVRWILVSNGTLAFSGGGDQFVEGVGLAGGYDATSAWTRTLAGLPQITVPSSGKTISNWSFPTEWQQVKVSAQANGGTGGSSVALWISGSSGLSLSDCEFESGNAGPGSNGGTGNIGNTGTTGGRGDNGCEDSSFLCSSCSDPQGGGGGGGCASTSNGGRGGSSGNGGSSGFRGDDGSDGPNPNPPGGGLGGSGGPSDGDIGFRGGDGNNGDPGTNGTPGAAMGTFGVGVYSPAGGGGGDVGQAGGGGGGGGGGAGGGWTSLNCDTRGGGGGGGGGGGCGGTGATPGTGGGMSAGVVLLNGSSVSISGGAIRTGGGGRGGDGGAGGSGGNGGGGGNGGSGESSIISEQSGPGGQGGDGGDGGRGGHGGGGGGGPTFGVHCDATSGAAIGGVSFSVGSPGSGGSSQGAPGTPGQTAQEDCP